MSRRAEAGAFGDIFEVAELVAAFEAGTLPLEEWNHPAHLAVALWYLWRHDEPEAVCRMMSGIRRFNHAKGIGVTPTGGYHETITIFWLAAVRSHAGPAAGAAASDFLVALNELIAHLGSRPDLVYDFYSRERLWSAEARSAWVSPDLRPLEELRG